MMATNGISETRTSINCENIPELFLDKLVAKTHFSRFGKIKRFILRPSRLACTVEYEDPESALKALERGGEYKNHTFSIAWTDLKPASFGDNGKVGSSPIDLEVQMELEAIDHTRGTPSQNMLAHYKTVERSALTTANNRPSLPKPALPPAVRAEIDPKIKQARGELETLARKPAFSAEERYRVLEAKDRYIRLTTERTTDIRKAKNIEGTCPDMCPEKERYLREWKCMVPSYEKQPGGGNQIDHVKAIKQYSRSSADQELPLPHELRSQHALGRTMHFLLTNLADLCDDEESEGGGNVSDWFHYIWDRTRGIRKDITQQDLCSPTVVELVEQCTRFHIHCAARLVSEDPSVFDQKINTENMTKCLQTLKYMYTDLAQRGQRCPLEAEFRAYMVLLYLNDGNFLWELRQLPEAIIHSNEIQFALSVYFALEENNFVRFFQLVRSTTYMNACILLRYFTQVRQKALDILRKAYAVRSNATFSLEYMTSILGFEDQEEAVAFFDHYGIVVDETTDMVIFEPRQLNFYKPDLPFRTSRAVQLVESKRTVPIGEAICGRPLEQWENQLPAVQRPTDSFDANGCLREQVLEKVFADRKETEESVTPPPKPSFKDTQSLKPIEEDKVDSSTFNALQRDETMSDDRIFKVPSPTIVVPRVSPRARTPPTKPAPSLFAVEPPNVFATSETKPPAAETSIFKTSTIAPGAFSTFASTGFGKSIFGSVNPPSTTPNATDGGNLFNTFSSSSATSGGSIFGQTNATSNSTVASKSNIFHQRNSPTPTLQYASPPTIAPAGQTFFQAAKETSLLKPQTPSAASSASLFQPKLGGFSQTPSFGGDALSSSVNPFGQRTSLFEKASTILPVPVTSSPALSAGFFQQPLKEKNENKEKPSIALPIQKELDHAAELEKQKQEKKKQEEERKRQQEQREAERKKSIEKASSVELEKLIDDILRETVPDVADTALTRHKRMQQYPLDLFDELSEEILKILLPAIAKQEKERMERIKAARTWKLSVKYFHRWHRHAQSAARWRRLMRTVPPSFVNGSIGIDQLPRCDQLRSFLNARFTTGTKRSADEVLQDRDVRREVFLFDAFPERQLIDPFVQLEGMIHQLQTLAPTRLVGLAGPICWKLVISVPTEGEEGSAGFPSFVHRWLKCCAFRKDDRKTNHPYFYLAIKAPPTKQHIRQSANSSSDASKEQRAICMRLLKGQSLESEKDTESTQACKLSDGILFFLSDRCQVVEARKRLNNILAKSGSAEPSVAVMLYSPNSAGGDGGAIAVDDLEQKLGLVVGVVKRWRVFVWCKVTENDTLREAITYLTGCYRAHLQFESPRYLERLEMRPLTDFLECCVGSEMWFRLDKACRKPDGYTLAGQNGNAIVELYNSIVSKVQSMVDQDLKQFVQLPEEFGRLRDGTVMTKTGNFLPLPEAYFPPDWHSSERRKQIIQVLKSLELRPIPNTLQNAIDLVAQQATTQGVASDVTRLRTELSSYLSSYRVLLLEDSNDLSTLTQRLVQGIVSQLAGYVYEIESRQTEQSEQNGRHCYWVPILALVSETMLRAVLSSTSPPLEVCYRRNEFLQHTETDWWKDQLLRVQEQAQKAIEESQANTSFSNQSRRSSFTTTTSDRKRTHKELSQHNDSCVSISDSFTSYSDCSSFSDSIRSDSGKKRTKLVNGVPYSQDIVDDVLAQGMRALAKAEQMLSQRQTTTTELQSVFNPLEQTILDVEKSCRTLQYQHGKGTPK